MAALIAAERDNNDCIVGVIYCKIIGVRLFGSNEITDSQEAQALSHCIDKLDMYSNSWGPTDGYGFWDPGDLAKSAIQKGVTSITTSIFSECSDDNVQGTSFSTPIATGIIELALQANLVLGFGLMNAIAMVTQARSWTSVPAQRIYITITRNQSLFSTEHADQLSFIRDIEYTGRIIVNTTRRKGFVERFCLNHTGYIFRRRIGDLFYYMFDIDKLSRKANKQIEDTDIRNIRLDTEVEFIQQEVRQPRVLKTADPEWYKLWHLNNDISPSMQINEAWNIGYTGRGIKIAILDDGLQTDHADLVSNVDLVNDYDYVDDDNNPMPPYGSSHGTEVAGLIAAEKDNNECIVGVAHQSTIVGVRLLGNRGLTDSEEAQALNHHINEIDIYSNSWGPPDGYGFYSPGTLTKEALKAGVQNGRNGNGVIFIFASGNGMTHDNCNGDGYVNSIYTVAITSVQQGQNAWYSEVCAPALAATYGGSEEDRYLTTTTTTDECKTNGTQGTSFSAPIASGVIALALQANPYLTWRDVQHLIVLTSSRKGFNDTYSDWSVNGANKEFSQVLGYGLMDAEAMVSKAKTWATVPVQHTFTTRTRFPLISTRSDMLSSNTIFVSRSDSLIRCLEQVTVRIKFSYSKFRGVTELYLVSPSGTESNLLHFRYEDAIKYERRGSLTWTFMSVHFWWENPVGIWRLKFGSYKGYSVVTLISWSLTFYGTSINPLTRERAPAPTTLSINTSDLKSVSTTTKSTLLPTTVTEPISTSKTTYSLRTTTSDILSTETATIADWVTTDYFSLSTTSTTGSDSSYFNSNNKPVIIGGVVAGVILIGTIIVFISWKIIAGRVKDVDSTTTSTAPAVFSA